MTNLELIRLGLEIIGIVALTVAGGRFVVVKKIADVLIDAIEIHSKAYHASGKELKKIASEMSNANGVGVALHFAVQERVDAR